VRVASDIASTTGRYTLRVDRARGIDLESDRHYSNDSLGQANPITLHTSGSQRHGRIAGTIMTPESANVDEDYFDLGTVEDGETILVRLKLPATSTLRPVLEIRNAVNHVVSVAPNPTDETVTRVDVSSSGSYYAVVLALEGQGPFGQYLLDVTVAPTAELQFADLSVTSVTGPTIAASGQTMHVQWTVGNYGTAGTDQDSWHDRVVLSNDQIYGDMDDLFLGTIEHFGVLGVDEGYSVAADLQVPLGVWGDYSILVKTDAVGQVFEFILEDNNIGHSEAQISIELTPWADLSTSNVTAPTRGISGEPVTITWEVTNTAAGTTGDGTPAGIVDRWIDRIVLSLNSVLGDGDDRFVADIVHEGALSAGQSYLGSWTGPLPSGLSGDYEVWVFADFEDSVYEYADPDSNLDQSAQTILVAPRPYADLTATILGAPSEASIGDPIQIEWTVENTPNAWGETPASLWYDWIVLSQNTTYGDGDDWILSQAEHESPLAVGDTYTTEMTATLPSDVTGVAYLFAVADGNDDIFEFIYEVDNHSAPHQIEIHAPDLIVESVVAGTAARFGDPVSLDWTVHNQGSSKTMDTWDDRIWLSKDGSLGIGDALVATIPALVTPLAVDQEYVQREVAVPLPLIHGLDEGGYFLLVEADGSNQQTESDENNNVTTRGPIELTYPDLPDLQVSSLNVMETDLHSGGSMTVRWSLFNASDGAVDTVVPERIVVKRIDNEQIILSAQMSYDPYVQGPIASGASVLCEYVFVLPDGPEGAGQLEIKVMADWTDQIFEYTDTGEAEDNNTAILVVESALAPYPDLALSDLTVDPANVQTGDEIALTWQVENIGAAPTSLSFIEEITLTNTDTGQILLIQTLVDDPALPGLLEVGQTRSRQVSLTVPDGSASVGQLEVSVAVDPFDDIYEYNASSDAEGNNDATTVVMATLAPYPDLAVVHIDAPTLVIGDPPAVTVSWTVENQGLRATEVDHWHDVVIVSEDDIPGDSDDIELARYAHESTLSAGGSYTRSETFLLPAEFIGRYHLFVRTDITDVVFEDGSEANNAAESSQIFDAMLIPYADLVVTDLQVPQSGFSGQSLAVTWTVMNQGIGTTNKGRWTDRVWLTEDPSALAAHGGLGRFSHYGHLEVDGSYTRTGHVVLPDGLEGNYYIVIGTGGPFEFIYDDNNHAAAALQVQLTPPPDLVVTDIVAPETAEEGSLVDICWTVTNQGTGPAEGSWEDKVYLQRASDPTGPHIEIGCFTYEGVLEAGMSYTRWEAFTLPEHIHDLYQVVVTTNHDREEGLYEHGTVDNNTTVDDQALAVSIKPRPDLQVASVSMPSEVDAGGTFSVEYVIINQGTVATTVPHWYDNVYLSLDNVVSYDDILVASVRNQSALAPGESYLSISGSVAVPLRFRGEVYILVFADAGGIMDEWPNDNNNILAVPIYVEPLPLPDLVTGEVVCPQQAVEGAQIEVRYTVTNLGSGQTLVPTWIDTIWLTQDKNRPHPGLGDMLLASIEHSGSLPVGGGYDQTLTVTLPQGLASGTYYIMPWSDPYDVVLEDTLAINVNPDDPHEINNNNYKARAIDILGTAWIPDLVVTEVTVDPQAMGGDQYTVTWTVENQGTGPAEPAGWIDRIHLYTELNEEPWIDNTLVLAEVAHSEVLAAGASYTETVTVTLSPSAVGKHILVYTDALVLSEGMDEPQDRVSESNEENNQLVVDTDVRPIPADLVVTNVLLQPENLSGENTVIQYTVTNMGEYAVWSGTEYWVDCVWISADPQWRPNRGSYIGKYVHSNEDPLQPGESYTATVEGNLPIGIGGDYFIYVHMDTHRGTDLEYGKGGTLWKDWWPANVGFNATWLEHFKSGAFEDPHNNLNPAPVAVMYYEPDLVVTNLVLPGDAMSGQTIPVTFTVANLGTRETREDKWSDRVFLSRDPSLDGRDLYLGQFDRQDILAIGDSYTAAVEVRLPDGIEGDFYVLAFADSPAVRTPHSGSLSDIGFGLPGVYFPEPDELPYYDRVSETLRLMARGRVREYQQEGNNLTASLLPVTLTPPPDLQVTTLAVPNHTPRGQPFELTYTVSNRGGPTPGTQSWWDDLVYLSRDTFLDLRADRYLDIVGHTGGLGADESYTVTASVLVPTDMLGPYYVFVITDPVRDNVIGRVFEHHAEHNNDRASEVPMIVELPPATDLAVTNIQIPSAAQSGDPVQVQWTVTNVSDEPAQGTWSDTAYLSTDATWDIADRPIGRVSFNGTLLSGESYTSTLDAYLPPAIPGQYRIIVRTDIFNQVWEDLADLNNKTASPTTLTVTVEEIVLAVLHDTTLSTGQQRLFQVVVPQDQTLRVTLTAGEATAANELFIRHLAAPTSAVYDASYAGGLSPVQRATVPRTEPGVYYILVQGYYEPEDDTPATLLAELLPLTITEVHTDIGGDAQFVTTTIRGAQFHEDAIVKLVRPGFAEYEPVLYEVIDSTKIIATFDLTGAPHGLYDLAVINPGGDRVMVPYRFQVERALEPDVTIGVGGPRAILAGDVGTYSVALQSISNVDTPYTYFEVGIPEMGINAMIYDLPYVQFFSNVRGSPESGDVEDVPWASLDSAVNTTGQILAPGYLLDHDANGFTGFTFNVATYPGLQELHDRAWEGFKQKVYAAHPAAAELDLLDEGPQGLDDFWESTLEQALAQIPAAIADKLRAELENFSLSDLWNRTGAVPDKCRIPFIPFRFHVLAAATAMSRGEFIAHASQEALELRERLVTDPEASPALLTLAADEVTWVELYLAALEEAELLRPEGTASPIREHPQIISLMATLATGILIGPAGTEVRSSSSLIDFFDQVRAWYGHDPDQIAEIEYMDGRSSCNMEYSIPVPAIPSFEDYDLGLSQETHFEAFRIYVPWIPFEERGAGLPPDFQINGPEPVDGEEFQALDLTDYLAGEGTVGRLASLTGPQTIDTGGFLPVGYPLPYTIHFENAPTAATHMNEIRIVTTLDEALDPSTFRLGDIKIGQINVHIPSERALFQRELDFAEAKGFILRISAGIDVVSRQVTWLIQAIDPLTGELLQDPTQGLLPPDNAQDHGAGFVTYTVLPIDEIETGIEISAQARVLFDNAPPEDTYTLTQTVDATAPTTSLEVQRISENTDNYLVEWEATDDTGGSGLRHVTIYVATDGGNFEIWQRQVTEASGSAVFEGQAGHSYEFLALATDAAGNQEQPPFSVMALQEDTAVDLGAAPTVPGTTPPNFGIAPEPSPVPSTNPLFEQATQGIPAAEPIYRPSEFDEIVRPFTARAFATGIEQSYADIGPMALAEAPDSMILVSGGYDRSQLFRFGPEGGDADNVWVDLDHPIFNLAFDDDGNLWATTGGGPLLQLDPDTGEILNAFADGLTITLAVEPDTGHIYVSSGSGIEIFDPSTQTFTHYSRDRDLRVGSLAFAPDGSLWAVTWPDRRQVVRFNERARAESVLEFDTDIDSLAFGVPGTELEGLLFVSHNHGAGNAGGILTMVDVATLRRVTIARGGTRGDVVLATSQGRLLLSQSHQVDVFNPVTAPMVVATNPPDQGIVALPFSTFVVVFDQDMLDAGPDDPASVANLANYTIFGETTGEVAIQSATYVPETYSVFLIVSDLKPGDYQFSIADTITSLEGLPLSEAYVSSFTAISDFSPYVDIQFATSRSSRGAQTVSWDVTVTNVGDYDLELPIVLVLDPAHGYEGIPTVTLGQAPDGCWYVDLSSTVAGGVRLAPGESTTGQTITIYNPDNQRVDYDAGIYTPPTDNQAPVFDSDPVTEAVAGELYVYQAAAHDPDGIALIYFLYEAPVGMQVDALTGLVEWYPTAQSQAQTAVTLRVYDTRGGYTTQEYVIDVEGGNRAPIIGHLPDVIEGTEGQVLEFPIPAADPDGDALAYWADNLPPGASFDPRTHTFSWKPSYESAGTYDQVTFMVSDSIHQVSAAVTMVIAPADQPLTLAQPADRTIREGDRLRFYLEGGDPDGGPVAFLSNLLPPGAFLDPNIGLFDWTPEYYQAGVYEVPFSVADDHDIVTRTMTITVLNTNAAPVFDQFEGWVVYEGEPVYFYATATDPDNPSYLPPVRDEAGSLVWLDASYPSMTFTADNLPAGATFDPETSEFYWVADYDDAGDYTVTFSVTDDGDGTGVPLSAVTEVAIEVMNFNQPPVITEFDNLTVERDQVSAWTVEAADPDGNPVILAATSALPGYPLPDFVTFTDHRDGTGLFRFAPGVGDRGDHTLVLTANDDGDGGGEDDLRYTSFSFVVTVLSENEPPVLTYVGDKVAVPGDPLTLEIQATDLDQDPLTFSVTGLSAAATLTPGSVYGTATLDWTPTLSDVGIYSATIEVTDSGNDNPALMATDSETITLVVRQTNSGPVLTPVADLTVAEEQLLTVGLSATDLDNDILTYKATNLPVGAVLDPVAGVLSWTPTLLQAGIYDDIVVRISDGHRSHSRAFDIAVTNVNQAPQLVPMPVLSGREGTPLEFRIVAGDFDGDGLVYQALAGLPEGAQFNRYTGTFSWTPDREQAGKYTITFGVLDPEGLMDTMDVVLRIANVNRVPVLQTCDHWATLGQELRFFVSATDPDLNTILTYGADGLPEGATFDTQTGEFIWVPGPGQAGDYPVVVTASDGAASTQQAILIRAAVEPELPQVTIELTPSFPAIPGQSVFFESG